MDVIEDVVVSNFLVDPLFISSRMDVDSVVDSMDKMAGNTADKMVERMDRMGKTDNGLVFFFDASHNCHNHNPNPHRFGHNIA